MTLLEFRSLASDSQLLVVQHKGVFLLRRTGVGMTAKLYQVEGFYVELFFEEKMAEVLRVVSFEDTAKLELYLQQVDIGELEKLLK